MKNELFLTVLKIFEKFSDLRSRETSDSNKRRSGMAKDWLRGPIIEDIMTRFFKRKIDD